LAVISPSKGPPPDDAEEVDGAEAAGVAEPEDESVVELLHAVISNATMRIERRKTLRGDWGISLKRKTANRIIEHPFFCFEFNLQVVLKAKLGGNLKVEL